MSRVQVHKPLAEPQFMSSSKRLYLEWRKSELERGYTLKEADEHLEQAVASATQELWDENN